MVHSFVSQTAVRLYATRQIRITAGNYDNIALERTVFLNNPGAVDASMEAVLSPKQLQHRALGEELGRRTRHHQLIGIELVNRPSCVERIELDSERGVRKLRAAHHRVNASGQGRWRLR